MFSPTIRVVAFFVIGVAALALALGAILFQAAIVTQAAYDYTVSVTWWSALTSVIWPPSRIPFLLLCGVAVLACFTAFMFFRATRAISVIVLFLMAGVGCLLGGQLGGFFIWLEFAHYHFTMDAERLGENWFTYEGVAAWSMATALLAALRVVAPKRSADAPTYEQIPPA